MTGICFENSAIDVDVQIDQNSSVNNTLNLVYQFLNQDERFKLADAKIHDNVDHLIANNRLNLNVTHLKTNSTFQLCLTCGANYNEPHKISRLIQFYTKLDERFKILAFCLRHLARVSFSHGLDDDCDCRLA